MSNLAFLLPLIFEFFRKKSDSLSVQEQVSRMSFRLLCGLILSSVIIFSLIMVGRHLSTILLGFEYGIYLSLGIFGLVAIAAAFALFTLFKAGRKAKVPASGAAEVDLEKIMAQFCAGLAAGMNKPPENNN